jgi:lysophospholipase L1-like esterase
MKRLILSLLAAMALAAPGLAQEDPDRFEKDIRAFEQADRAKPPQPGGVVFYGSSTIRRWDLDRWFPAKGYINRGFGGSTTADAIRYFDRSVAPLKPATIVYYEGDNDVARGMAAPEVFAAFRDFAGKVKKSLPNAKVVYLAIKPSVARAHLAGTMRAANLLIREYVEQQPGWIYVDTDAPMLGPDGQPPASLFVEDGLHLSDEGYTLWTKLVAAKLK